MTPKAVGTLVVVCFALPLDLYACASADRGQSAQAVVQRPESPAATAAEVLDLDDKIDIELPDGLDRYPTLARAVEQSVERHRQEFEDAATDATTAGRELTGWELQITYQGLVGNRYLRVVRGDGYTFTGGAHGEQIIERFTYEGIGKRVLEVADWFVDERIWPTLGDYTRQQLSERAHAEPPASENADYARNLIGMIEEGTRPEAKNFALYEPVFSADGPVIAFRILFPPYQVAPYSEGIKTVDVPIDVVAEHLRPESQSLLEALAGSE